MGEAVPKGGPAYGNDVTVPYGQYDLCSRELTFVQTTSGNDNLLNPS